MSKSTERRDKVLGRKQIYLTLMEREGASQMVLVGKNPPARTEDMRRGFDPWVRKIPQRRTWQPTPVFLPGESHGLKSLAGYSP